MLVCRTVIALAGTLYYLSLPLLLVVVVLVGGGLLYAMLTLGRVLLTVLAVMRLAGVARLGPQQPEGDGEIDEEGGEKEGIEGLGLPPPAEPEDEVAEAVVEGADASFITVTPTVMRSNYTQIFMEAVQVSGTADVVSVYGRAKDSAYALAKSAAALKRDLEKLMPFSLHARSSARLRNLRSRCPPI